MQTLLAIISFVILVTLTVYHLNNYFKLPDVHFDQSGNCIRVLVYDNVSNNYSCENLPNKYIHYHVK